MRNSKGVVCLSGGADSTTLLYLAVTQCSEIHAISINYGQRHIRELACAKDICKELTITHKIIDGKVLGEFGGSPLVDRSIEVPAQIDNKQSSTVVPYRNTFIAVIAAAYCYQNHLNTIYMGPTWEDQANYSDCRPSYINSLQETLRLAGTIHNLEIRTPFIDCTKDQIILLGKERFDIDYSRTYTCYSGHDVPCMVCDACRERAMSFYLNGFKDPLVSNKDWEKYTKEMLENKIYGVQ